MDATTILKSIKLGHYFTAYEFANKDDGNAIKAKQVELFEKLDMLRVIVGSTDITSGYRTSSYNSKIGGSSNSNHLLGHAVDVKFNFTGWAADQLAKICVGIGFKNIGIYMDKNSKKLLWLHLDIGSSSFKRWNEGNGWKHQGDSAVKYYYK